MLFISLINTHILRKDENKEIHKKYFSKEDLISYSEFSSFLIENKIEKIIIDPNTLNSLEFAFEGLVTIKIKLKDKTNINLLPVISVNNFLKNLEKIQIKNKIKEENFITVEFLRSSSRNNLFFLN